MHPINCKICGGETIWFVPQFELLKCKNCGFIFYQQRLSEREIRELYNKLYNEENEYSTYKEQAALLNEGKQPYLGYNKMKVLKPVLMRKCKKIIEIGAGVGVVGNYLQKKNIDYQGIELDKEAATLAKEAGINILNASFQVLEDFKEIDAVFAFEVIEHIDDIKLYFELMSKALAQKGYGATLNDKKIRVSNKADVLRSCLVTGFPYTYLDMPNGPLQIFERFIRRGIPVRRLGSAAIDLCWVAAGRFDGFYEMNLQPWDSAAGFLIVEEAGGRVTDFKGKPFSPHQTFVVATNGVIHEELLDWIEGKVPALQK